MNGETNLKKLIATMSLELTNEEFVYCTLPLKSRNRFKINPICEFQEKEGVTVILKCTEAKTHKIASQYPCKKITLNIHSSLNAVGFLAAICNTLAKHNISVNPVSGYYHDHLFVPSQKAKKALQVLYDLRDSFKNDSMTSSQKKSVKNKLAAIKKAMQHNFPVSDIEQMNAEIEKSYLDNSYHYSEPSKP